MQMSRDAHRIRHADDDRSVRAQPTVLMCADGSGLTDLASWEYPDLISWGMDSIRVMAFANGCCRAGLEIKFAELIEQPTLAAWWALLDDRVAAPRTSLRSAPEVNPQAAFPLTPVQRPAASARRALVPRGRLAVHTVIGGTIR